MRSENLSDEAMDLLRQLREKPSVFARITSKRDPRLTVLESLDKCPETVIVRYISSLLFDDNRDVANRAAKIIGKRLRNLSNQQLVVLDHWMRARWAPQSLAVSQHKASDLSKLEGIEDPLPVWLLLSLDSNGHVRELAVKRMAASNTGQELAFLIIRLNDWVPEVRQAAKKAVLDRITSSNIRFFVENLDVIERIYSWQRTNHSDVLKKIEEVLTSPLNSNEIKRGLKNPSFRIRRLLVKFSIRTNALPLGQLYEIIKFDKDAMVRLMFLRLAKHQMSEHDVSKIQKWALNDRFMNIRKEFLQIVIEKSLNSRNEILGHFLFDRHASIRELARWYRLKDGATNAQLIQEYRNALNDERYLPAAILGLGEVGHQDDIAIIQTFLSNRNAKVRKSAVRSILKLSPESLREEALEILESDLPTVAKEVRDFLSNQYTYYASETLWNKFITTEKTQVKLYLLNIFERYSKWKRLKFLLLAASESTEEVLSTIERKLSKWLASAHRSAIDPQPSELSELAKLLQTSSINHRLLEEIRINCPFGS